jgi:hypothetical protein
VTAAANPIGWPGVHCGEAPIQRRAEEPADMTIPASAVRPLLPALACALLAAGCASPRGASLRRSELAAIAASRGVPAGRVELPFAADDGMREWLREQQEAGRVLGSGSVENRLSSLIEALLGSDGLGLR